MPLAQLLRSCPAPPAPPDHVWSFRCQRTGDVPGPVPRQGARLAAPPCLEGCLAPPAPPCDAGRAPPGAGATGSDWGLPVLPAPLRLGSAQPRGLPGGALLLPPSPSCPWLSPARSGGPQQTRPLQPLHGPRLPVRDFSEWKNPSALEILARFSEAKRADLAPCSIGTSLSLHSCLHLETPLKSCVCVDLTPRGRQQTRRWGHNSAPVLFG